MTKLEQAHLDALSSELLILQKDCCKKTSMLCQMTGFLEAIQLEGVLPERLHKSLKTLVDDSKKLLW